MSVDEFGGPAPRERRTEDGIELDRWNRYVLPDPLTGELRNWTRASTVAKVLPDTYHLDRWKQRGVALGLARRHDLLALVASIGDPHGEAGKAELNAICGRALDAAGGTQRRDLGIALHAFTASHDRGLPQPAPPQLITDVSTYAGLLRRENLTVVPAYVERVVCVPEWGVAGRLDRVVSCLDDDMFRVADVKTGARADEFGDLEFVVQQGIYVRGLAYGTYNPTARAWEPFPYVDRLGTDVALIIHLPVGEPDRADVYAFDISGAAGYIEQALSVRESRRAKNLRVPWRDYAAFLRQQRGGPLPVADVPPESQLAPLAEAVGRWADTTLEPLTPEQRVTAALDVETLSALWQELYPAGLWSVEVHELAMARRTELERVTA